MLPQCFAHLFGERHLREEECSGLVGVAAVTLVRAAAIETPVPGCEDQNIAHPQFGRGLQHFAWQIEMFGRRRMSSSEG